MKGRGALVVFAKVPRRGGVKTRLCPPLSPAQAAAFYGCMLDDVLEASAAFARSLELDPVLALAPAAGASEVIARAPSCYRVIAQRGRDLSRRMEWAAAELAASGATPVLLRGSDSPCLGEVRVGEALRALERADVALCPDTDGGYNLVGLRRPVPGLFDHPMSTAHVLDDTVGRASALGLSCALLAPSFDVDTAADLRLLERARREGDTALCPRTLAFLDERDLWRCVREAPGAVVGAR
jgi:rSAM/selenodomain-associated transferase 1